MRCLTLAQELKKQHAVSFFLSKSEEFDIKTQANGVVEDVVLLDPGVSGKEDAQAVVEFSRKFGVHAAIIDHYHADEPYQQILRTSGTPWLQFDGFAQYKMFADWVLASSPAANDGIYESVRRSPDTVFLLGPKYALLREEFAEWRARSNFHPKVQKILLTFGGGDDRGATLFCLKALHKLWDNTEAVVLLSSKNPHMSEINVWMDQNRHLNITIRNDEHEVARCMTSVDMAIIAGGTTTFEVAAMGLPALTIQIADNQAENSRAWDRLGSSKFLGPLKILDEMSFQQKVRLFVNDIEQRRTISTRGKQLVDGLGASRVADILLNPKREVVL